jgi:hypothetical protein
MVEGIIFPLGSLHNFLLIIVYNYFAEQIFLGKIVVVKCLITEIFGVSHLCYINHYLIDFGSRNYCR